LRSSKGAGSGAFVVLLVLGLLVLGSDTPRAHSSPAVPESTAPKGHGAHQAGRPVDPTTSLGRECITHRASGSRGRMGGARFAMERADNRFRPRSAALTRRVVCGFRSGTLVSATEQFYLQLVSEDRENPGFTTGAPNMSARFYIVCEGGMRTTLPTFVEGQVLSFADNTFTLPCGQAIYPADVHDPAKANRITGLYSYKVRSATLAVRMGPTVERPTFDVTVDVLVVNPIESLHLRGRVSGRLSMVFAIVDCPTVRLHTKQAQHPGCP
jgi:hypothetical protein